MLKVKDPRLVRRQYDLYWVHREVRVRTALCGNVLDESAREAVHHAVSLVVLASGAEYLVALEPDPVALKVVGLGLEVALSLEEDAHLLFLVVAEAFNNLLLFYLFSGLRFSRGADGRQALSVFE